MSIPKIKEEALRWLTTAKEELDAAEHLFSGGFRRTRPLGSFHSKVIE